MIRERHVPLLCRSCERPISCQESTCWRCGAEVRRSRSGLGGGSSRHQRTRSGPKRSRREALLRRGSARRRAVAVPPQQRPDERGHAGAVPNRAADHARWQRERAESRLRTKRWAGELVVAITAGEAAYRILRRRLDRYGARLAAVRVRLVGEA